MTVMPQSWTDERLDDFRTDVNRRFDEVDRRFDEQRAESLAIRREMKEGFERVDRRFEQVDERFARLEVRIGDKFERMYRLLLGIGATLIVAVISNHL